MKPDPIIVAITLYFIGGAVAPFIALFLLYRKQKLENILCRDCEHCGEFYDGDFDHHPKCWCQFHRDWIVSTFPSQCRHYKKSGKAESERSII